MITEDIYSEYLSHLLSGRRTECNRMVQGLLDAGIAVKDLYKDLLQKSLYEIGWLWERNKISVAREHLATAITEGVMNLVYPALFRTEKKRKLRRDFLRRQRATSSGRKNGRRHF